MYYVKLSDASTTKLQEMIGLNGGRINLAAGIVRVDDIADVKKIAERFCIDNVNYKQYDEIMAKAAAQKNSTDQQKTAVSDNEAKQEEMKKALEERNKIIGYKLEIGSVVRVKREKGCEHGVIVAICGKQYNIAKLVLSKVAPAKYKGSENVMIVSLEKGKDIVYRNTTYKDHVTLIGEIECGLKRKDFLASSGGMVVGKVTNLDLIQPIIDAAAETADDPEPESANDDHAESEQPRKRIDFQKAIEESETLEELFSKLEVASDILMQAAMECIETGRSNMKKLIPVLQSKYDEIYGKLTQTAIKSKLNQEFENWCKAHDVDLEECSVNYFLTAIVKGLKK